MTVTREDLVKALGLDAKDAKTDRAVYGEVMSINEDQTYQVSLNGSDTTVKCARLSGAKVGDTVLVEILANGYSVVTGTVGGDTDASDAQASAAAAMTAAGQAQSAAGQASTAAAQALTKANEAEASASAASTAAAAAQTAADTADQKATAAGTAAAAAQTSADNAATAAAAADSKADAASAAATRAETKADTASAAASRAETAAGNAETSAANAQSSADSALVGLSTVQDVVGVLNWITAHGTMTSQSGGTFDDNQVYFVLDDTTPGDYHVGSHYYSLVAEPKAADINSYYVLSVDESVQNYVATHLVVDSEGLWLIPENNATPATSSKKILIAVGGSGHTYETAGTYIIGKVNNVDKVLAKFLTTGATVGQIDGAHSVIDGDGQRFYASNGTTQLANIGYGETQGSSSGTKTPYYTLGVRATSQEEYIGGYSLSEGYMTNAQQNYAHSEGYYSNANSVGAHAEGGHCSAEGTYSHAQNYHTQTLSNYQTAIGKYNTGETQTAFEIGNGTGDNARSNAFTVYWDGNTVADGDIMDGSGNKLSDKANASAVPTKTSDLTNDSGFTGYPTAKVTNTGAEVAMSGLYVRRKVAVKDNISVTSGNYVDNSTSVSTTGYTLLGVLGYSLSNATTSGTGGMYGYIGQLYCTGNTVYYRICNRNSSAIKVKIEMDLLYFKS